MTEAVLIRELRHHAKMAWLIKYKSHPCWNAAEALESQERLIETLTTSAELLESLCTWLLHRFGPDSPEGRESGFRATQARAALSQAKRIEQP